MFAPLYSCWAAALLGTAIGALLRQSCAVQRNRLFTSMPLGNNAGTEIRTRLRLRSTVRGANNRLDVDAIVSYDRGGGAPIPMLGQSSALSVFCIVIVFFIPVKLCIFRRSLTLNLQPG